MRVTARPLLHKVSFGIVAFTMLLLAGFSLLSTKQEVRAEVANDVSSGLVLWWKANASAGISVDDSSSSVNTGGIHNMDNSAAWSTDVPYSAGGNTNSLRFNYEDTDDYVISGDNMPNSVVGSNQRTMCGWVKLATISGDQLAFNYGSQSNGRKFGVYASSGHWWFWGYSSADMETTATLDTNWHNHCVTYDGAAVTYYFDGVNAGSASRALNTTITPMILGQRDSLDAMQPFKGNLDDVRLYDRVLSEDEILNIANVNSVSIDSHPSNPSNDTTGTFTFSATNPGAIATHCKVDAGTYVVCANSFTTSPLADGNHTFIVDVTDMAGNHYTDSYNWTVDTTSPDTFITRLGSTPSTTSTSTIILTSNESATYECNLDNGGYVPCDDFYVTPHLVDGMHNLLVRATDSAGNVDQTPASETWSVDTTAPHTSLSMMDPPIGRNTTLYIFSSDDEQPSTFECSFNDAPYTPCTSPYTTPVLTDGEYTLRVRATDGAGNVENPPASDTWDAVIDTDGDSILDAVENAGPNNGDANNDDIQDNEQPTVASFINPVTGDYQVIVANDCDVFIGIMTGAEPDGESADANYDYPMGLTAFYALCGGPGQIGSFEQYFYGVEASSNYVFRKWVDDVYSTMGGAAFEIAQIDGQSVLKVSYQIEDGGENDEDGEANAYIRDPGGPALAVTSSSSSSSNSSSSDSNAALAGTGQSTLLLLTVATGLLGLGVITIATQHRSLRRSR